VLTGGYAKVMRDLVTRLKGRLRQVATIALIINVMGLLALGVFNAATRDPEPRRMLFLGFVAGGFWIAMLCYGAMVYQARRERATLREQVRVMSIREAVEADLELMRAQLETHLAEFEYEAVATPSTVLVLSVFKDTDGLLSRNCQFAMEPQDLADCAAILRRTAFDLEAGTMPPGRSLN
jgi:hypothetical protein